MAITGSTISALSSQMPGQSQKVTSGLQEAAKTQMRQQVASQGPMGVQQIQALGQQAAAQQGQAAMQGQQQAAQTAQKLGGVALTQQQQDAQKSLQNRQLSLSQQYRSNEQVLNNLDTQLKGRLIDDQFQFQQDELGRTLFNDRQLMDYKIQTAKSDLEMRDFEDKMRQTSQRRIQLLKASQAKIEQEMQQNFAQGQQRLDQQTQTRMAEAVRDLKRKIAQEQADAANRASMFSAGGTLLGAAAGIGITMATGGVGAAVLAQGALTGAGVGSGLGSMFQNIKW